MTDDPWYFPRNALAEHYLSAIESGASTRVILHAPRRKGKTAFLLRDVAPLAASRGHSVLYVSMWSEFLAPHRAILSAVERADKPHGLSAVMRREVHKLALKAPYGFGAEVTLRGQSEAAESQTLDAIGIHLEHIARRARTRKGRGRLLLMLDEIQHLSTSKTFVPLAAKLRTVLDVLGPELNVIYTGSMGAAMRLMFHRSSGLFYASASEAPFPDLGKDYISHVATTFQAVTRRLLTRSELRETFERLDHNPGHLMEAISEVTLNPSRTLATACAHTEERIADEYGYAGLMQRLTVVDRAVLRLVVEGRPLYSEKTLDSLSQQAGKSLTVRNIQYRLTKLMRHGTLMPGTRRGEYFFQDGLFQKWFDETMRKNHKQSR